MHLERYLRSRFRSPERCKSRPLASGAVSLRGSIILLSVLELLCIGVLGLAGDAGIMVGLFGLLCLDPLYPLMKRWTHWPQAFLGLALTWALPTAWVSINGFSDLSIPLVLSAGSISWTIYYDTIYASQDRRDDLKAGVKSTAVLFGDHIRPILSGFAAVFIATLTYAGVATGAGASYYVATVLITSLEFVWQMAVLDFNDAAQCWSAFKMNGNLVGGTIWVGMFVDYLVATHSQWTQ